MNKIILATSTLVLLLGLIAPVAVAAAPQSSHQSSVFGTKFPVTVKVIDSFGNIYTLTASGKTSSYTISGSLSSSPYLAYTPWTVTGHGSGGHFTWTNNDPNPEDSNFCSWTISATISGNSATGTWANLGCGGGSGSVSISLCTKASCGVASASSGNGPRPGV